jgi:hypothetical protein
LIEAMMSGRAVVGVDVGAAAETIGDAGVLVQPDDPAELAIAIVGLLRAPNHRRQLGDAARRRALSYFTNDRVVRVYGALYSDLSAPPPALAFELALAVPAPRAELPATLRWLTPEEPMTTTARPAGGRHSADAQPTPGGPMPAGPDDAPAPHRPAADPAAPPGAAEPAADPPAPPRPAEPAADPPAPCGPDAFPPWPVKAVQVEQELAEAATPGGEGL